MACGAPKTVPLPLGGGSSAGDGGAPLELLPLPLEAAPSASLPLAVAGPAALEAALRLCASARRVGVVGWEKGLVRPWAGPPPPLPPPPPEVRGERCGVAAGVGRAELVWVAAVVPLAVAPLVVGVVVGDGVRMGLRALRGGVEAVGESSCFAGPLKTLGVGLPRAVMMPVVVGSSSWKSLARLGVGVVGHSEPESGNAKGREGAEGGTAQGAGVSEGQWHRCS